MKRIVSIILLVFLLLPSVYADSSPSYWAKGEYDLAKVLGLVIPEVDDNFQEEITRRQFCQLIVNMVEKKTYKVVPTKKNPFLDVDDPDVTIAYELGIVKGVSETKFAPDRLISRQEIAVMMMRAARVMDSILSHDYAKNINTIGRSFADQAEIANWAIEDVKELNKLGLMEGVGGNKIAPLRPTTIEQSILLVYRLYRGYTDYQVSINNAPVSVAPIVEFSAQEKVELTIPVTALATDADGDSLEIVRIKDTYLEPGIPVNVDNGTFVLDTPSQIKYTSTDITATSYEQVPVHVSDGLQNTVITVKITITKASPLVGKENLEFETPENKTLTVDLSSLVKDFRSGMEISGVYRQVTSPQVGVINVSADKKSFEYKPTENITMNKFENLIVNVTEGDKNITIPVKIIIKEVGNVPPQKAFSGNEYVLIIPPGASEVTRLYTEIVTDPDGDPLEVLEIKYKDAGSGPFFVLASVHLHKSSVLIPQAFPLPPLEIPVLEATVANIIGGPTPGSTYSDEYLVTFSDGTDQITVTVKAVKQY